MPRGKKVIISEDNEGNPKNEETFTTIDAFGNERELKKSSTTNNGPRKRKSKTYSYYYDDYEIESDKERAENANRGELGLPQGLRAIDSINNVLFTVQKQASEQGICCVRIGAGIAFLTKTQTKDLVDALNEIIEHC